MTRSLQSALWFFALWLRPAAADDEVILQNGGSFQQLICVNNKGSQPIPASTVSYEVGAVQTKEESTERSLEDMHEATVALTYKYGFSVITSLEMSASYTYQHKETTTTSQMTSSTVSEKLTLTVPEVAPQSTWCAYRLQSMTWSSGETSQMSFFFRDIIVTDEPLQDPTSVDLVIRGSKQNWESSQGYLLSTMKWGKGDSGWILYMQDHGDGNVRGWEGDPGVQGHVLFSKRDDGTYLFSTAKWPNWYIYMQDTGDGNVRGWESDPGPQGHFLIKPHPYKNCYLISTQEWPDWFMYMQDNKEGNVRGWEGDPGDQGCWDITLSWTVSSSMVLHV